MYVIIWQFFVSYSFKVYTTCTYNKVIIESQISRKVNAPKIHANVDYIWRLSKTMSLILVGFLSSGKRRKRWSVHVGSSMVNGRDWQVNIQWDLCANTHLYNSTLSCAIPQTMLYSPHTCNLWLQYMLMRHWRFAVAINQPPGRPKGNHLNAC